MALTDLKHIIIFAYDDYKSQIPSSFPGWNGRTLGFGRGHREHQFTRFL
jgi:hypothetical protein